MYRHVLCSFCSYHIFIRITIIKFMRHMTQYEQYLPSKQTPTSIFHMNKSHAVKNCLVYRVDFINNRLSSTNRQILHRSHKFL